MSTLETIKQLVETAKAKYAKEFYSDAETFTNQYLESLLGLQRDVDNAALTYPIQFDVDGDFYFFQTSSDLVIYIVSALNEAGMVYNDDDYYDSSEYEDSGC